MVKEVERPGRYDLARLPGYYRVGNQVGRRGGKLVKTITREELKAKMDRGDETLYCWRRSGGSVLPPGAFAGRDPASGHWRRG